MANLIFILKVVILGAIVPHRIVLKNPNVQAAAVSNCINTEKLHLRYYFGRKFHFKERKPILCCLDRAILLD